jgi:thiol-disulfide isomerase/thioredoxin
MRRSALLCLLSALVTNLAAQGPERIKEPPVRIGGPALQVGDAAPVLKVSQWLQGNAVPEFAPGKVYVVEFWAAWSRPSVAVMPLLAELQGEYRDKGVTIIGHSTSDPASTREQVAALLEKRGAKLGYTFAHAEERAASEAWMKSAGKLGIPCAFVIDKTGRIAYIGHPMYLPLVLPKVVAGTWTLDDPGGVAKIEPEVAAALKGVVDVSSATALKTLGEFETKHPALANSPYFLEPKLTLLVRNKKFDDARQLAEAALARAERFADPMALRTVSVVLHNPLVKDQKELTELSIKAAEAGLKLAGEQDSGALLTLAEAYFAAGNRDKAKEYGARALTAAEKDPDANPMYTERQVRKFDEKKGP